MVDNKTIEKPKKPRSEAQIKAFEKAKANRMAKIAERKAEKEGTKTKAVEPEPAPVIEKPINDFPKSSSGINPMDSIKQNKKQELEVEVVKAPRKKPVKKPIKEIVVEELVDSDSDIDLEAWANEDNDSDDEDYEEVKPAPLKKTKSTKVLPPKPKVVKTKPKVVKKEKKVIYITDSEEEEEQVVYKKKPKQKTPAQETMNFRDRARLAGF